ncbi:hypothetical protein [Dickeya poaceiphila]|uniref:Uncharacterized protein n=1 Tax=Dickeya poaceiphila TaxID=568768 RepID=A0A5B8I4I2_9GAMM|nr:hypothetical protein [Dickeya poaceiphila]QDX29501.1 hypothetical protein Dpoa569_0001276 [Dickeya poaceiphila]
MNANNETACLIEKIKSHLEIQDDSIKNGKIANWQYMYQRYTAPVVLHQIIEYIESVESQLTALRQAQQEPVAYMCDDDAGREYNGHNQFSCGRRGIPLYIHPTAVPSVNEQEPAAFRWRHRADGEFPASKWEYLPADLADRFIERVVSKDRDVECEYVYTAPVITDSAPIITDSERQSAIAALLAHPDSYFGEMACRQIADCLRQLETAEGQRAGAFIACNRWHDMFREAEKQLAELQGIPTPPAPAVPDELKELADNINERLRNGGLSGRETEKLEYAWALVETARADRDNACRAAMIKQSTNTCQLSGNSEQLGNAGIKSNVEGE